MTWNTDLKNRKKKSYTVFLKNFAAFLLLFAIALAVTTATLEAIDKQIAINKTQRVSR